MHWKLTPNSHRLNRWIKVRWLYLMKVTWQLNHKCGALHPPNTQSHTPLDTVNEMRSVKSIIVSSTAVENYFMSVCVFVCRHRRVWVYERESILMWVSECTRSHILTVHNILLWQLAGNGHHRLTVYDNKQTCSRSPPLHLYLFNLCDYVFVGVGWWVYLSLSSGCKTPKPKKHVYGTQGCCNFVSVQYIKGCLYFNACLSFYKHSFMWPMFSACQSKVIIVN